MSDDRNSRTESVLHDPDTWADAPDVFESIMGEITTDAPVDAPVGRVGERRWHWWAVAAVVAFVVGFALGAGDVVGSNSEPPADFVLAGTELAPDALAEVRMIERPAGFVLRLEVSGLEPAADGTMYEGWVESDEHRVCVGSFHMRGGDGSVTLWAGVDPADYPRFFVTLEDEDGNPDPSDRVLMTGGL